MWGQFRASGGNQYPQNFQQPWLNGFHSYNNFNNNNPNREDYYANRPWHNRFQPRYRSNDEFINDFEQEKQQYSRRASPPSRYHPYNGGSKRKKWTKSSTNNYQWGSYSQKQLEEANNILKSQVNLLKQSVKHNIGIGSALGPGCTPVPRLRSTAEWHPKHILGEYVSPWLPRGDKIGNQQQGEAASAATASTSGGGDYPDKTLSGSNTAAATCTSADVASRETSGSSSHTCSGNTDVFQNSVQVLKCDYCNYTCDGVDDVAAMQSHLKGAEHYSASVYQYDRKDSVDVIKSISKPLRLTEEGAKDKKLSVICPKCADIFDDIFLCITHSQIYHNRPGHYTVSQVLENKTCSVGQRFNCLSCKYEGQHTRHLNKHWSQYPDHKPIREVACEEVARFSCTYCQFNAVSLPVILVHMKSHSPQVGNMLLFRALIVTTARSTSNVLPVDNVSISEVLRLKAFCDKHHGRKSSAVKTINVYIGVHKINYTRPKDNLNKSDDVIVID